METTNFNYKLETYTELTRNDDFLLNLPNGW